MAVGKRWSRRENGAALEIEQNAPDCRRHLSERQNSERVSWRLMCAHDVRVRKADLSQPASWCGRHTPCSWLSTQQRETEIERGGGGRSCLWSCHSAIILISSFVFFRFSVYTRNTRIVFCSHSETPARSGLDRILDSQWIRRVSVRSLRHFCQDSLRIVARLTFV